MGAASSEPAPQTAPNPQQNSIDPSATVNAATAANQKPTPETGKVKGIIETFNMAAPVTSQPAPQPPPNPENQNAKPSLASETKQKTTAKKIEEIKDKKNGLCTNFTPQVSLSCDGGCCHCAQSNCSAISNCFSGCFSTITSCCTSEDGTCCLANCCTCCDNDWDWDCLVDCLCKCCETE